MKTTSKSPVTTPHISPDVQLEVASLASSPHHSLEKDSVDSDESLDIHRIQALNTVCVDLAGKMGLEVVDRGQDTASQQTLSLFPKRKSRKSSVFKMSPEFLHQDAKLF